MQQGMSAGAATAKTLDDKIAALKASADQERATSSDPFDPVRIAKAYRAIVDIEERPKGFQVFTGRRFDGPVDHVDVMAAANRAGLGGSDPNASLNAAEIRAAYNHPTNQRMLAQREADLQAGRVEEARATGQVGYGTYEQRTAALKAAGAPYLEGGRVINAPDRPGTAADYNVSTGEWVPRTGRVTSAAEDLAAGQARNAANIQAASDARVNSIREGRIGGDSFSNPAERAARIDYLSGSTAQSDRDQATRMANTTPTTDQMRATLESARAVQEQVASRESQNTNPVQVQPNQPPPPLRPKREEEIY